ncbi:MAG: peroxiredoxin [Planctomycetes bacterium]|nr:peroxiredoxin [Planctomycetota bacterium]
MENAAAKRSPLVGSAAPDFKLQDDKEEWHTLADFRGRWVVLYFYPKDDTPGCTCEATEFTGLLKNFNDMGASVVGVSPDNPSLHRLFRRQYELKITLLSDTDHTVMTRYGAWVASTVAGQKVERVVRQTFLIDPAGTIRYHWPEVMPRGHARRVKEKLAELQKEYGQAATRPGDFSPDEVHAEALHDASAAIASGELYICETGTIALYAPGIPRNRLDLVKDLPRRPLPSGCTDPRVFRSIAYAEVFNQEVVRFVAEHPK